LLTKFNVNFDENYIFHDLIWIRHISKPTHPRNKSRKSIKMP
jgi:hypothetical protein